ncbi:metallophosphoesterase [Akkermansia muciniphila]
MEARPDMIFLLGDYANGHTRESSMAPETAREYFKMLKAPLGIFAVQGNHDQYYGWNLWRNMFSGLGILPMWNDSLLLYLPGGRELQLSSVRDDYHLRIRPEELPLRFSPDIPHILLSHVPDIFPLLAPGTADLVISAHTHGGQICLPGGRALANISREKVKFSYPWSQLNGTPFLITRGLGCSVLPLRFCCPPEIIVLEIQ